MPRRPTPARSFGRNLRSLFGWRRAADDIDQELRFHEDLRARDLEAGGRSPEDARTEARRLLGDEAGIRALCVDLAAATDRRSRLGQWLEESWQDVKYGVRSLRAKPGFAVGSVLTIALGLGANTAIFGVVNAVFLRPLPIDPDGTLVRIREYSITSDGTRRQVDASRHSFDAVMEMPDLVRDAVALNSSSLNLGLADGAERVSAIRVSAGFTRVLNVAPVLGRSFTADEENAGEASRALLISHRLWTRAFARTPDIVGRQIPTAEGSFVVVGVLPPGFDFPYAADAWIPARFGESERSLVIFGHLAAGVSLPQANARLEAVGQRLRERYSAVMLDLGLNAVQARDSFVTGQDRVVVTLMGSVAFLLLIACANVTMLMTSRLVSRQKEVVIRAALGCGRWRQIRQFVTESLLVFASGGAAGWLVAVVLKRAFTILLPTILVEEFNVESIPLDLRVAGFAMAVALVTGVAFGIIAAVRFTRADLTGFLRDGGRSMSSGSSRRTTGTLVAIEIALALVLLAGAGLMIQNFQRLERHDPGFKTDGVLTFQVEFTPPRYAAGPARTAFLDELIDRLGHLPGVIAVGATTVNPLCCGDWGARMSVEGHPPVPGAAATFVHHSYVTPTFFSTMGVPVVAGRVFTSQDVAGRAPVMIVDERFVRRYFPGQDPIGRRVKRGAYDSTQPWMTIVGVVGTVTNRGEYSEEWYLPYAQYPLGPSASAAHLMVRASGDPLQLVGGVRRLLSAIDPSIAAFEINTMEQLRQNLFAQDRLGALVAGLLAMAGLALATTGVYGLMAFAVAESTKEIGIRVALGASRLRVLRLVMARAFRLAAVGVAVGVPLALVAARLARSVMTDLGALDARIVLLAAAALVLAAVVAALLPARRALRLDPLRSLHSD